jgi:hypothetical protein
MDFTPFQETRVLNEAGKMEESASPDWWLSSGGLFIQQGGLGKTIHGSLPAGSVWQEKYAHKPDTTDNGSHPQNIFRLLTRRTWGDCVQELKFRISAYRAAACEQRNASNGVLFMSRYQDQHNSYYAGIRVDGSVVIKKKINGIYHTLAQARIYPGAYDRERQPILLPVRSWIAMRCEVRNRDKGVDIILSTHERGKWRVVAQAHDDDKQGPPFGEGFSGIRTDFMDAEFEHYRIGKVK